ncbi:hypothetical protein HRbin20_01237 [bacterium HR20]|nr:hypothetical protein HRbin20_01237 [bacterium HR20]
MPLGADDAESAVGADLVVELNVGAAPGHVGGDRDCTFPPCLRDDFCFAFVVLGVEHVMRNPDAAKHLREHLAGFDARCTDKNRTPCRKLLLNFLDDSVVLFALGAVDQVVVILANDRLVRGNNDNVELVDLVELGSFGFSGAGHPRELAVEAEVVLDRDGRIRLGIPLDVDAFFCFDRLVQSVRVASAFEDAAGELINDFDFVILDNVLDVAFVERVRPQQLRDDVDAVAALGVEAVELVLAQLLFLGAERWVTLDRAHLGGDVGDDKHVRVFVGSGEQLASFFGDVNGVVLLVNDVVKLFIHDVHVAALVAKVVELSFAHELHRVGVLEQLLEPFVLRHRAVGTQQRKACFFAIVFGGAFQQPLGFADDRIDKSCLRLDQAPDAGIHFDELFIGRRANRPADDERSARFVNED